MLASTAGLPHARYRVKVYWPSLVWALVIFIIIVQHWWAQFTLNRIGVCTFAGFLSTLAPPIIFYMLGELVRPRRYEDEQIDLYTWAGRPGDWPRDRESPGFTRRLNGQDRVRKQQLTENGNAYRSRYSTKQARRSTWAASFGRS